MMRQNQPVDRPGYMIAIFKFSVRDEKKPIGGNFTSEDIIMISNPVNKK